MKFPKVLAAIEAYTAASEKAESKHWAIGDALLAECGEPGVYHVRDGSHDKLQAAAQAILKQGYEGWDARNLSRIRQVAFDFPQSSRISGIAWRTHEDCGNPEFLSVVVAKARGRKVTGAFVLAVRDEVHKREVAKREAAYREAEAARKQAEAEEKRAETRETRQEARARKEAAQKAARAAKAAPTKKRLPPPTDEDLDAAAVREAVFKLHEVVSRGSQAARDCQKLAKEHMGVLKPVDLAALRELALSAMNDWRETASLFVQRGRKADHLSVVGE